jgi:hypothetical protein
LPLLFAVWFGAGGVWAEEPAKSKKKPVTKQVEQPVETPAAETATTRPALPPAEILLMLVRNSIVALNQANFTGNYTVLRDLGSPSMQSTSAADMGLAFSDLRQQRLDLSPALVLSPALSEPPVVAGNGILRLAGHFPTKPLQINFVMTFQPVAGVWRLHGLSVTTSQVQ